MRRPSSAAALALLLAGSGTLHLVIPGPYASIVPPALRFRHAIVYVSGTAELACAWAVGVPKTRRVGAWAAAVLFVIVFPANIYAAFEPSRSGVEQVLAWLRLPLQVPLVVWAVGVARRTSPAGQRNS